MNKHIGLLSLALLMLTGFTACSDNLDINQHGVQNMQTFYQNDEEAEEAMTAAYIDIGQLELADRVVKNLLSDDVWAGLDVHTGEFWQLNDYTFDAASQYITSLFKGYYTVIGKCNAVIDKVKGETDTQKQMVAEAKVGRAWMYFNLTSLWGTPPIVDHLLTSDEAAQPNASEEALYELMINDLTDAINSGKLTQKSSIDDTTNYRLTLQFAQALLGKVYLWNNQPAEAAEQFENVISSGLYGLFEGEYGDQYLLANENNRESMFETNFVIDESNPGSVGIRFYPILANLRSSQYSLGDNVFGICPVGWGGLTPRKSLYEAFVAEEGEDGYRLNQSIKDFDFLKENGITVISGQQPFSEGFYFWKTRLEKDAEGKGYQYDFGNNIHWMRYAEVLLLAAEANLAAGNQAKADEYLNQVRSRAHLSDKTATLDAIKTEKRLELCGEGIRLQDLLRWGDAATVLKDQGANAPQLNSNGVVEYKSFNTTYGFKDKHQHLPFPASEMRINKNLKQNTGW
jgi:hypothetical protein